MHTAVRTASLDAVSRPSGAFAMVANDARETLRAILAEAGKPAADDDLRKCKVAIAQALSPHASAMLVDRLYGLDAILDARAMAPHCGLIVSVDTFIQSPGKPVQDTLLDHEGMTERVVECGAVGLKFLAIWEPGKANSLQHDTVAVFVEGCRRLGVLSVLEGIARAPIPGKEESTADLDAAILQTARELGSFGPDVYKGQVPTLGRGTAERIELLSREVASAVPCPWVVLSGGVTHERFPAAVEAACRGGASGFLAGRGVWAPSLRSKDPEQDLGTDAVSRLEQLVAIVDKHVHRESDDGK